MILYHYEKGDRPITEGGFWFSYGGIPNKEVPEGLPPMSYVEGWDKDYVCCCDNIDDVLTYFPKEVADRLGGVFRIYSYDGAIIRQRDSVMEYITANSREMKLLDTCTYDEMANRAKRMKAGTIVDYYCTDHVGDRIHVYLNTGYVGCGESLINLNPKQALKLASDLISEVLLCRNM